MLPNIKNIIIFLVIATLLVLGYIYFFTGSPQEANLVSSSPSPVGTISPSQVPAITQDFLSILLNIKTIKLDDSIFSDSAFLSLSDSSILLNPEGNEGRLNPFAPIGSDPVSTPVITPEIIPGDATSTPPIMPGGTTTPTIPMPNPATSATGTMP